MSLDGPSEIERLRLELKKITADRDHLLVEKSASNSRPLRLNNHGRQTFLVLY